MTFLSRVREMKAETANAVLGGDARRVSFYLKERVGDVRRVVVIGRRVLGISGKLI